jgi:hypothetical protein
LQQGYSGNELAYIKPCTQCEDIQLVSKYCEQNSIEHRGLGPIVFYEGYTQECIDGSNPGDTIQSRHDLIYSAVAKIAENKKLVLVDGVGKLICYSSINCEMPHHFTVILLLFS